MLIPSILSDLHMWVASWPVQDLDYYETEHQGEREESSKELGADREERPGRGVEGAGAFDASMHGGLGWTVGVQKTCLSDAMHERSKRH